jgi:hypothetical protein
MSALTPEAVAAGLSELERELLTGSASGWGSWMFSVGNDLCAKGFGRKHDGSISFDTPLAAQVIAHLKSQTPKD